MILRCSESFFVHLVHLGAVSTDYLPTYLLIYIVSVRIQKEIFTLKVLTLHLIATAKDTLQETASHF